MNKKSLVFTIALLVLSAMVTPVMAIGPQKAVGKNPRITITPTGVAFVLPSGVELEWVADTGISTMDFVIAKNALTFKIRKATTLDLISLINTFMGDLTYENKWCYVELPVVLEFIDWMAPFMVPVPTPAELQAMKDLVAVTYPDGMYLMFVNVGK